MTEPSAGADHAGAQQSLHESLSAAIDDEAEDLELRRVLNAARNDPELRAKWQRAHLIGSAIRGEAPLGNGELPWRLEDDAPSGDGAPSSNGVLPFDDAPSDAGAPGRTAWWLRAAIGGAGLAAAVAFGVVALFGGGFATSPPEAAAPVVTERVAPPRSLARLPSELDLRRADAYLLRHAQHTAVASPPAAMPFAKVLAGQDGRPAPVPAVMRYERETSRR